MPGPDDLEFFFFTLAMARSSRLEAWVADDSLRVSCAALLFKKKSKNAAQRIAPQLDLRNIDGFNFRL